MSRAQQLVESWKEAETFQQKYALQNNPIAHLHNKMVSDHLVIARGKDKKVRGRAKAVLRHFVNWHKAKEEHEEKHKKFPTMDDLAAGKPKAIKAWRHHQRHVAPKERRYHKEAWLLKSEMDLQHTQKGK